MAINKDVKPAPDVSRLLLLVGQKLPRAAIKVGCKMEMKSIN